MIDNSRLVAYAIRRNARRIACRMPPEVRDRLEYLEHNRQDLEHEIRKLDEESASVVFGALKACKEVAS